jgi:hypothetical protein
VADCDNTDSLSGSNKINDHPRASKRLAGTRWSLDCKYAAVEREDDAPRAVDGGLSGFAQCVSWKEARIKMKLRSRAARQGPGPLMP